MAFRWDYFLNTAGTELPILTYENLQLALSRLEPGENLVRSRTFPPELVYRFTHRHGLDRYEYGA